MPQLLKSYQFNKCQNTRLHHELSVTKVDQKGRPMNSTQDTLFFSHMCKSWGQTEYSHCEWSYPKYRGTEPSLEDDSQPTQYQRDEYNRQFLKWQKSWKICQVLLNFDALASRIEMMESSRYLIDRMRVSVMITYHLGPGIVQHCWVNGKIVSRIISCKQNPPNLLNFC
jgi:hypothetical protein